MLATGADRGVLPRSQASTSDLVRRAAGDLRRPSVAAFEDLGVQMNRHSTLVSYLEKLVWVLTGNFGIHGGQYAPTAMVPERTSFFGRGRSDPASRARSPTHGSLPAWCRATSLPRDPHRPSGPATGC